MDAPIHDGIGNAATGTPFTLRNPDALSVFLRTHPGASAQVRAAADRLPRYFPHDPLVLEVDEDPEGAQEPMLFLIVRTALAPRQAVATLRRFDREWWPQTKAQQRLPIVVTVEPTGGV